MPPPVREIDPQFKPESDGMHALVRDEPPSLEELCEDERIAGWLHTGLGLEVG